MSKHDGKPVAILMAFDESYLPVARVTVPGLFKYAERHGYVLHGGENYYKCDPTNLRDWGDRGKIDMYCQLYDDFEMVMFLDTDAVIMDHSVRIQDKLGPCPFVWAYDPNGPGSGFWIARCEPMVKHTLLAVQRLAQERGGLMVKENLGPPHSVTLQMEPRGTSDQTVMTQLMHTPPYNEVLQYCYPGKQLGVCYDDYSRYGWAGLEHIGQYSEGDWIVTCPGLPIEQKVPILHSYAEKAKVS